MNKIELIANLSTKLLLLYFNGNEDGAHRGVGEKLYNHLKIDFDNNYIALEALEKLERMPNKVIFQDSLKNQIEEFLTDNRAVVVQFDYLLLESFYSEVVLDSGKGSTTSAPTNIKDDKLKPISDWKNWGDHPIAVAIGVIAGLIAIWIAFSGPISNMLTSLLPFPESARQYIYDNLGNYSLNPEIMSTQRAETTTINHGIFGGGVLQHDEVWCVVWRGTMQYGDGHKETVIFQDVLYRDQDRWANLWILHAGEDQFLGVGCSNYKKEYENNYFIRGQ